MPVANRGRRIAALSSTCISCLVATASAAADALVVTRVETGEELVRLDLSGEAQWCTIWNHSVAGFEVEDCYQVRDDRMVLVRSHQPDFAAGLGHIAGRGRQVSDGRGGYWINDLDEAVPGNSFVLRPGRTATVNHRIRIGNRTVSLSALAEHERVLVRLETGNETGEGE